MDNHVLSEDYPCAVLGLLADGVSARDVGRALGLPRRLVRRRRSRNKGGAEQSGAEQGGAEPSGAEPSVRRAHANSNRPRALQLLRQGLRPEVVALKLQLSGYTVAFWDAEDRLGDQATPLLPPPTPIQRAAALRALHKGLELRTDARSTREALRRLARTPRAFFSEVTLQSCQPPREQALDALRQGASVLAAARASRLPLSQVLRLGQAASLPDLPATHRALAVQAVTRGMNTEEVAEDLGESPLRVYAWALDAGLTVPFPRWSSALPLQEEALHALRQGLSVQQVARRLFLPLSLVRRWANKLDLGGEPAYS